MHITYRKKDLTYVEKCDINVTVGNNRKMKCRLKGSVKMKLQDGKTVKLTKVLYVPQSVKNLLIVSRLVSKGSTMGGTWDKMIIKKNGVSMILSAKKFQYKSMKFYLKVKRYAQEGQEALTNLSEKKKDCSGRKK